MFRYVALLGVLVAGATAAAPPTLDGGELSRARDLRVGESATFAALPIAPGRGAQVRMRRIDVYAPHARILVPQPDGSLREVPRSDRIALVADRSVPGAP
ncbi:MAG TPA: hypothetical protein VFO79_13350, partial [Xanthomonadales bacterium]|nr:hypothetical protein [Xanthomonadales bacterium]